MSSPSSFLRRLLPVCAALLACLLFAGSVRAEAPHFQMQVSPQECALGDQVTLTVEIRMPGLSGPDRYWHPRYPDFDLIDSQIKRATHTVVDPKLGQRLETVEIYRYILKPKDTGRHVIESPKIRVGNDEFEARSTWVRVRLGGGVDATQAEIGATDAKGLDAPGYTPPAHAPSDVFLYAVTDKTEAWLGEQITVSWLLFARTEVLKYEPTPPKLSGVWSETLFEPEAFFSYQDARIGRRDYLVALVSKRAFFASAAGPLTIAPLEAKIATVSTALGGMEKIASQPIELQIKALPDGAPKGFDPSYVGDFEIDASVDRDFLPAGQPLTLSLRIRGTGAVRRTEPLKLDMPGFSFREPRDVQDELTKDGDLVAGSRVYHYWTTPTRGGEQTLPAIDLPFFNPATGEYAVTSTKPIGVTVEGDPSKLVDTDEEAAQKSLGKDIRLLHASANVSSRVLGRLYRQSWFWWLLALPPLCFSLIVAIDRLRAQLTKETPRARLRRARGKARAHLRVAEIHLRGQRPAKFFAELSHAIHAHLEEWLQSSMRSLTQGEMRDYLEGRGVGSGTVTRLLDDLSAFDRARFAASSARIEDMKEAMRRTRELLTEIEGTTLREERR